MNYFKEKEMVELLNLKNLEWYSLVNNYGFKFTINNNMYDARHWLNCYGAEVNFWGITDIKKMGTKNCHKQFGTLEELLNYLKNEFKLED